MRKIEYGKRFPVDIRGPIETSVDMWDFFTQYEEIKSYSAVDVYRCFLLYCAASQAADILGNFAELGVYRGGTAKLLARIAQMADKRVYLFDTFAGHPKPDPMRDLHKEDGYSDVVLEKVLTAFRDCPNADFYVGVFPQSAVDLDGGRFAFVHIDADIYQSVKDGCEFFWPRLTSGGYILFDDYGASSCPGAKMAVEEYFADKPETLHIFPRGQCLIRKP